MLKDGKICIFRSDKNIALGRFADDLEAKPLEKRNIRECGVHFKEERNVGFYVWQAPPSSFCPAIMPKAGKCGNLVLEVGTVYGTILTIAFRLRRTCTMAPKLWLSLYFFW